MLIEYTILAPEVAGGWGAKTVADTSVRPPIVSRLDYEFQGWLGDELLESFPCFIVSDRVAEALQESQLTGFTLDDVRISSSAAFEELHSEVSLPRFRWLRISGQPGISDSGLAPDHRLVVSLAALSLLSGFALNHAVRTCYGPGAG
jgi:hypothetical protein